MMHEEGYETRTGGSFTAGLLAGALLGAGVALLFAPRPGAELRKKVSESAGDWRHRAEDLTHRAVDTYHASAEKMSRAVERGKDAYEKARHFTRRGSDEPSDAGHDAGRRIGEAAEDIRDTVSDLATERPRFS